MILFQDDWKRYPSAIPDYNTNNKSFLVFCKTLQEMGIKNCLFPLALHNPKLSGVDPHDPNLDAETKIAIFTEWWMNPWYFLREIARIEESGVEGGVRVIANRGIISQWWCLHNSFDIFMMQPRQTGKSIGMDLHHVDNLYIRRYKSKMVLLTKDTKLMIKNVKKLKAMRDLLPEYLLSPNKKDKDVEHMLNYTELQNEIAFIVAQNDEASAINASRGHTVDKFHGDEIPFIKYFQKMMPTISSSMDTAIARARENGITYGRAYTTTAGDLSLPQGRYAYELFTSGYPWTEELFDQPNRDAIEKIVAQATGLPNILISMVYNHRQLGIPDEEFWRRIKSVKSTDEDINKDYFLVWGKGGKESIIDPKVLEAMDQAGRISDYVQVTDVGYAMKWWVQKENIETYMKENKIIMGIDTSNQINRDSTSFKLINAYDLSMVASLTIKKANIITTVKWLASFVKKYENITIVIENKSSAQTFIDYLINTFISSGINPFKRIWNRVIDDPKCMPDLRERLLRGRMPLHDEILDARRFFGFMTSGQTRDFLFSKVLDAAATQSKHVQYDADLTNQIALLKITEEGRVDHISGGHDDMVIAWLLAHWALRYGKYLEYYGLDPSQIMRNINEDGELLTEQDHIRMEYIEELQQECEQLVQMISRETLTGLRQRYLKQLDDLMCELTEYGAEPRTASQFQEYLKTEGKRSRWERIR